MAAAFSAAGALRGLIEILPHLEGGEAAEMGRVAGHLAQELAEDIKSRRDLVSAEQGNLVPACTEFDAGDMLTELCLLYRHHSVAARKKLPLPIVHGPTKIYADQALLSHALGNLIKNALEASSEGQTVRVSFENNRRAVFAVHNETAMPEEVQLQVFQRSFSTKAKTGRGTGTYSAKLLTERYLKGEISFHSSPQDGTTFTVTFPAGPSSPA